MSKDKIQSLRQKCQNVQIESHLQRKDKLLVTFFFFFSFCIEAVLFAPPVCSVRVRTY